MKTILLCGNGMSGEAISHIKSWGYKVALISEFSDDRGVENVDFFINTDSKDPAKALEAAVQLKEKGVKIDGVISLCWDSSISVSTIASAFGLFGVSVESATKATKKDLRSTKFEEHGIPAPKHSIVDSYEKLIAVIDDYQLPIVLKPVDQSSSKGVIKVKCLSELLAAYQYVRKNSSLNEVIVNECIVGSEHSVEGLMVNGTLYLTALSDRVFEYEKYEPYFVEVGDVMPSELSISTQNELYDVTRKAALSLGITDGVVKGDIIVDKKGAVWVLEIAARLGGPRFGTEMVPLSNGTNLLKAAIQQCMGEEIDLDLLKPKYSRGMVNRSVFPMPGRIKSITGLDQLKKSTGFYDFKWWDQPLKIGDEIHGYTHGCGGVAYFIVGGLDRNDALVNADEVESKIVIKTSGDM